MWLEKTAASTIKNYTLQGLTYPTLGKGKSSSKCHFLGDMLVSWRVYKSPPVFLPNFYLRWVPLFPTTHSNQTNFLHFRGLTTRAQKPENQRCHFGWWKSLRVTADDFHLLWDLVGFIWPYKNQGESGRKLRHMTRQTSQMFLGGLGCTKLILQVLLLYTYLKNFSPKNRGFFYPKYIQTFTFNIQTFTPHRIHGTNSIFTYHENHKDPPKW